MFESIARFVRFSIAIASLAAIPACVVGPAESEMEEEDVGEAAGAVSVGDKFKRVIGKITGLQGLNCAATAGQTVPLEHGDCKVTVKYTFCRPLNVDGAYCCVCDAEILGTNGQCGDISTEDLGGLGL